MEFFNPKMRRELEKKDDEIKRTTGLKGSAPGGDDWTYLSGNTRVPVSGLYDFHIKPSGRAFVPFNSKPKPHFNYLIIVIRKKEKTEKKTSKNLH